MCQVLLLRPRHGGGKVVNTGYSCYLTAAGCRWGRFFLLLVDLGPGAAANGMQIEINTGYSCYLTANRSICLKYQIPKMVIRCKQLHGAI